MANDLRSFILNEEWNLKLAADPEAAIGEFNSYIDSDPALQERYRATYDDIFGDEVKTRAWRSEVASEFKKQGLIQNVQRQTTPQQGLPQVPADGTEAVPPTIEQQEPVLGGSTSPPGSGIDPAEVERIQSLKFSEAVNKGLLNAGVPFDKQGHVGWLLSGTLDPDATDEMFQQQMDFAKAADRVLFDPQVFFPAMAYVAFGNWPGVYKVALGGAMGSIYSDMVNRGAVPNVMPPFTQTGDVPEGEFPIEQIMGGEYSPPDSLAGLVTNAGEMAIVQGLWEALGIIGGGMLGGVSKTRSGVLGRDVLVEGYDEAIKYADKLGIKFPGAFLTSEGYARMIWEFSHATITSEPLYNKWVAGLVKEIGEQATDDLYKLFQSGMVDNVTELMNPRDIGRLIGDTLSGAKVFSDLGENFMWRRLQELDKYGIKVDMGKPLAVFNNKMDSIVANAMPENKEQLTAMVENLRAKMEDVTFRSQTLGVKPKAGTDYIERQQPKQLSFTAADAARKFFRRYSNAINDPEYRSVVIEMLDALDTSMAEAATRVGPEASAMYESIKAFTAKKHQVMDKEIVRELLSKHGGKKEMWAGIAEDVAMAAKSGEGPDLMNQLDDVMDYFIENRRAFLAGEYDIDEKMVSQVVDTWSTDPTYDLTTNIHGPREDVPLRFEDVQADIGFKGNDVDDVIRRIRKDMTYDEFTRFMFSSKDDVMNTLRASVINDLMGITEELGEMNARGGAFYKKTIDRMGGNPTDTRARARVQELAGFDPIRLNAEIFHGPAAQKETYRKLFTKPQLNAIEDITRHLAIITGGGQKYKSNVMVVKIVQAGVLATMAVKSFPVGEDDSYGIKDAAGAGLILVAPYALTRVMINPLWAKWFTRGFTNGVMSRQNITNVGRLSMALWQEEGVPLFVGAGLSELQNSSLNQGVQRVLQQGGIASKVDVGPDNIPRNFEFIDVPTP